MHVRHQTRTSALALVAALVCLSPLQATAATGALSALVTESPAPQTRAVSARATLFSLFEAAWSRQPEAQSHAERLRAAESMRDASSAWTADAPAMLLQGKLDRPGSGAGSREVEVGVALPLWLPGQSQRAVALSDAQILALHSSLRAQRLALAGLVREGWWQLQRTHSELALAQTSLANAQQIARDVARRVKAGDLARADQHQAEGAVAQAESQLAQAQGAHEASVHELKGLSGWLDGLPDSLVAASEGDVSSPLPAWDAHSWDAPSEVPSQAPALDQHPLMAQAMAQEALARAQADLAASSRRGSPELTVLATRSQAQTGEPGQQSITLGLRLPLGGGARADARQAEALAAAQDAQAVSLQMRARLKANAASALARLKSTHAQWQATQRQAQLAQESKSFFDKSFRLGQTDLPTRLRIEQEALQAQQALSRARTDVSAAWSAWRQAMGELPKP
jgi:outer membrane protein, heavy metal efflux system